MFRGYQQDHELFRVNESYVRLLQNDLGFLKSRFHK